MAESPGSADSGERYAAIEQAYCENRWNLVLDRGKALLGELAQLQGEMASALRPRIQLLMAHAYLYGFQDRDPAEDLYLMVLTSPTEPALRQIAAQGLTLCNKPVTQWTPQAQESAAEEITPASIQPSMPDPEQQQETEAAAIDGQPDFLAAPRLSWESAEPLTASRPKPVMPWLQGELEASPETEKELKLVDARAFEESLKGTSDPGDLATRPVHQESPPPRPPLPRRPAAPAQTPSGQQPPAPWSTGFQAAWQEGLGLTEAQRRALQGVQRGPQGAGLPGESPSSSGPWNSALKVPGTEGEDREGVSAQEGATAQGAGPIGSRQQASGALGSGYQARADREDGPSGDERKNSHLEQPGPQAAGTDKEGPMGLENPGLAIGRSEWGSPRTSDQVPKAGSLTPRRLRDNSSPQPIFMNPEQWDTSLRDPTVLVPDVLEEPELIEVHQARHTRVEPLDLHVRGEDQDLIPNLLLVRMD